MKKIIQFIKYNNAFTIIISLIMFSSAGAFASEKVRNTVIGQTIITKKGTDNTQIISANLANFDMGLKIKSVKEDTQFYYVNFDYNAIDAKDGVWQSVVKEKNLNVSKSRLGDMDLGVYLAEELKQLTDREMAYMKEVQGIEKSKGERRQVESVEYTGLKGLVFNNETKELVGYEPVKEEEDQKAEVFGVFNPSREAEEEKISEKEEEKIVPQITVVKEIVSKETIMQMVKEALAQEKNGSGNASVSPASLSSSSSAISGGGGAQISSESSFSSAENSSSSVSSSSESSSSLPASSSSSVAGSSSEPTSDVGLSSSEAGSSSSYSEVSSSSNSSEVSSSSEASSSSSEAASSSSETTSSSSTESSSSSESPAASSSSSSELAP